MILNDDGLVDQLQIVGDLNVKLGVVLEAKKGVRVNPLKTPTPLPMGLLQVKPGSPRPSSMHQMCSQHFQVQK